jgi:hypothetical protein
MRGSIAGSVRGSTAGSIAPSTAGSSREAFDPFVCFTIS